MDLADIIHLQRMYDEKSKAYAIRLDHNPTDRRLRYQVKHNRQISDVCEELIAYKSLYGYYTELLPTLRKWYITLQRSAELSPAARAAAEKATCAELMKFVDKHSLKEGKYEKRLNATNQSPEN